MGRGGRRARLAHSEGAGEEAALDGVLVEPGREAAEGVGGDDPRLDALVVPALVQGERQHVRDERLRAGRAARRSPRAAWRRPRPSGGAHAPSWG